MKTLRTALLLALAVSTLSACKKKQDEAAPGATPAADKTTDKTTDKPAAEPAAAAAGPVATNPKDLFADFTKPNADGMALLDKYHEGATFSGKVSLKGKEEDGKPILWMELDGGRHIDLGYKDVEKAKGVKDGDTVTVTCQIGGAMDKMMQVLDCT